MRKKYLNDTSQNDKECQGCTVLGVSQMDPVYFLPTVPMKRAKPIWMTDQPSFILSDNGVLPPDKPKPLSLWSCAGRVFISISYIVFCFCRYVWLILELINNLKHFVLILI